MLYMVLCWDLLERDMAIVWYRVGAQETIRIAWIQDKWRGGLGVLG